MDTTQNSPKLNRQGDGNSKEIMADIEQTRRQMDRTLDALGERLHPRHLLDDLLHYFRSRPNGNSNSGERTKEVANQLGRTIVRSMKHHPIPTALFGAGLAWLIYESETEDDLDIEMHYTSEEVGIGVEGPDTGGFAAAGAPQASEFALPSHYESAGRGSTAARAREKGREWKEKLASGADSAKGAMSAAGRSARRAARSARRRSAEGGRELQRRARAAGERGLEDLKYQYDEHPLAMGVGMLALGILAGIALPSTRREDRLMGSQRDRVMENAKNAGKEAAERTKEVVKAATQTAAEEAKSQGLTPEALKEKASHVFESTQSAASSTIKEEGLDPQGLKQKAGQVIQHAKDAAQQEGEHQKQEFKQT